MAVMVRSVRFDRLTRWFVAASGGLVRRRLRWPTVIKAVTIMAITALLVLFLVSNRQWGSSGEIRIPVRIMVFDASQGKPISDAHVAIFHAPPLLDLKALETEPARYQSESYVLDDGRGITDANGLAVFEYEFQTGASHERPTTHAYLQFAWVHVHADGYGGVVVPVRQESMPTKTLREQKELAVPIGLIREN